MKGLKKVALASAIAAVSAGVQAELKALDDSTMGELTGQAGLTIDVETKLTLGEFMYKDAGSVVIQNIQVRGNTNEQGVTQQGYLDNVRLVLDIAGGTPADSVLSYGMSDLASLAAFSAAVGNKDADIGKAAAYAATKGTVASLDDNGLQIDARRAFGNGDLVIHSTFTDAWQKGGGFAAYLRGQGHADRASAIAATSGGVIGAGSTSFNNYTFAGIESIVSRAVDFNFSFEVLGLASSARAAGAGLLEKTNHTTGQDADSTTTTLISDLSINGYFGPSDFVITNRGNGFQSNNGAGIAWGSANSKIEYSRFINITDLDVYIDIAGVQIKDMKIHNTRGDQSSLFRNVTGPGGVIVNAGVNRWAAPTVNNSAFGFAHSIRDIYATKDSVLNAQKALATPGLFAGGIDLTGANADQRGAAYDDGLVLDTSFKGDIDIPHLSFGNTGVSIGEIYLTDLEVHRKMVISAH